MKQVGTEALLATRWGCRVPVLRLRSSSGHSFEHRASGADEASSAAALHTFPLHPRPTSSASACRFLVECRPAHRVTWVGCFHCAGTEVGLRLVSRTRQLVGPRAPRAPQTVPWAEVLAPEHAI